MFGRLVIAFHNAGIQNVLAEIADATAEDFDRVTAVNLRGVRGCMKYELQQMRKQALTVLNLRMSYYLSGAVFIY
ncbi:SDR family oxidoreductase [Leclercia sp.]|uniref:SDR family oxidoreductase n=1 Tax=Leclercia sp. TaxID=1898428 RepID=UPI0022A7C13C|nr:MULTISPECIES: SDR family oxidoreductase [unclassified Leclercia]